MDTPAFSVLTTAHFDRLLKKLTPRHPGLVERFEEAIAILSLDPHNKNGRYAIKKLRGVSAGEGGGLRVQSRLKQEEQLVHRVPHESGYTVRPHNRLPLMTFPLVVPS